MRRRSFLGLAAAAGAAGGDRLRAAAGAGRPRAAGRAADLPGADRIAQPDIKGSKRRADPQRLLPLSGQADQHRAPATRRRPPVTVLTQTFSPVPPAVDRNSVWSHLNAELGSDLRIQLVPQADYATKFATVVAGDACPTCSSSSPTSPGSPN